MSVKELKEIYENGFILEFDDNDKNSIYFRCS